MNCPVCHQPSRVLYTDAADRRRECTVCQHRFTTTEIMKDDVRRWQQIIAEARALAEKLREAA